MITSILVWATGAISIVFGTDAKTKGIGLLLIIIGITLSIFLK